MNYHVAGLNPLSYWHHNDHVGVFSVVMNAPLLLSDLEVIESVQRYYPELEVKHVSWQDYQLEKLAQDYNVFLRSDLWKKEDFVRTIAPIEEKLGKRIRTIHCPHGFSDKGFWLEKCVDEDLTLLYGQHMIDILKKRNVWQNMQDYVLSGNYRLSYYQKHKTLLDQITQEDVFSHFEKQQPCILYAPTWPDEENSSTFFDAIDAVIATLPPSVNLLVKLHPMIEEKDIASLYAILARYEDEPNVYFLDKFPLIYPLLFHVEAYLGDASAVGYDFLATNKPMVFLASSQQNLYLHRCGPTLRPDDYGEAIPTILNAWRSDADPYQEIRQEVYHYTFGEERDFSELRTAVFQALDASASAL